jgi:pilus assembly protein CpaF
MNLSERLRQRENPTTSADPIADPAATPPPAKRPVLATSEAPAADPLADLKQRTADALFARLGARLFESALSEDQLRQHVTQEIGLLVDAEQAPLTAAERQALANDISADVLGYGPIERFLADPTVTEIMVNGDRPIYVERNGRLHETTARFMSNDHVRRVIERIVANVGRRIDESSPMVDARLPDGSRVNAVIPPLAVDGPVLTIRKFALEPYRISDLVDFGTLTTESAAVLHACVWGKLNVLVTGGTGTGKTTLLNVLSGFIPDDERIVTIEDAVELQLAQRHVIRLESRPPNIEGRGQITIRDLVRNALRMRPDRIVVGEARGGEALDMLQAMNTGHEGSLSTVHANTPRDALARIETMVLMAGVDLPAKAIREQITSAIDLIVHISRMRDGSRRVTQITEVVGMEGGTITMQDVFAFDYAAGIAEDGRFRGVIRPTGLRPTFTERLADQGVKLPAELLGSFDPLAAMRGEGN